MKIGIGRLIAATSTVSLIWAVPAYAEVFEQETAPPDVPAQPAEPQSGTQGVADIVVTAQRRAESVQDTPIAITALAGGDLEERRVTSVEGLNTLVPNLNFGRNYGVAQVAIRGLAFDVINPGAEARAAVYNDNIYISRPGGALANFFDVARAEVLRGPQGTLYGRNATAGALNVISRDPTDALEGYGRITIGNYRLVQVDAAISGALTEKISARLALQTVDRAGFGKNIVSGQDVDDERSRAVRAKIVFQPTDTFNLKLTADYNNRDDASAPRHAIRPDQGRPDVTPRPLLIGAAFPADRRDIAGGPIEYRRDIYGIAAEANWDLADAVTLTSLAGYRDTAIRYRNNTDGSTAVLAPQQSEEVSWQFSQELRASVTLENVKLIVGGYYFREKIRAFTWTQFDGNAARPGPPGFALGTPGVLYYGADFGGRLNTEAYAAFGQADFDVTDKLQFVLGGRYSHERKVIDEYSGLDLTSVSTGVQRAFPTVNKHATFSSFDPKFTVNFKPDDDVLMYATFSQGFKSGGFALGALVPAFRPEKLKDYEIGVKADFFDRLLRTNLAAFYYDYKNLQVTRVNGTVVTTENAANATIKGIEAEIRAVPVNGLQLGLNLAYLDAKFDEFFTSEPARPALGIQSLAGNRIPQSPRYTVTADAVYEWKVGSGEMFVRGDVTWKDRIFFSAYNRPETSQAPFALANAGLGYRADAGWEVSAFARNVTNKLYTSSVTVGNVFGGFQLGGQLGEPRTYGIAFGYRF